MGKQLDISAAKAESIISEMIREERIKAQLDQLSNSVEFKVELQAQGVEVAGGQANQEDEAAAQGDRVALPKEDKITQNEIDLHDVNTQIHAVCHNIDSLIQDILKDHPNLQQLDTHIVE